MFSCVVTWLIALVTLAFLAMLSVNVLATATDTSTAVPTPTIAVTMTIARRRSACCGAA